MKLWLLMILQGGVCLIVALGLVCFHHHLGAYAFFCGAIASQMTGVILHQEE